MTETWLDALPGASFGLMSVMASATDSCSVGPGSSPGEPLPETAQSGAAGISHAGREGELLLARLVHGTLAPRAKDGDVLISVDGVESCVEVKTCRAARSRRQVNQVRAINYLPLIIYAPPKEPCWIVLPAHVVVWYLLDRSRGQHSEVVFESATLTLGEWADEYACTSTELPACVAEAVRALPRMYPELHTLMKALRTELCQANQRALLMARKIFR